MTETKTPLTDSEAERFRSNLLGNTVVPTNFARSLELRLAEQSKMIAELEEAAVIDQREVEKAREQRDYAQNESDDFHRQLAEATAWRPIYTNGQYDWPELGQVVLALCSGGLIRIAECNDHYEWIENNGHAIRDVDVVAWKSLPDATLPQPAMPETEEAR